MSKRFTDTTKWTDKWFRKLSVHGKLLFLWLVDNCDNAGFWEVDLELAAQQIGISEAEVAGAWEGLCRAYTRQGEYVWIKRFIRVQGNCPLNPDNNAHKQILSLFQEHADFGVDFESALRNEQKNSPSLGPKEVPCKGNGNGHSKSKGKHARDFELFWQAYPRKVGKGRARKWWDRHKPDERHLNEMLCAIAQQKKSASWLKDAGQFISHPTTWLNGEGWLDELGPLGAIQKKAAELFEESADAQT